MIKKENFSYRKPNPAFPGLALFLLVIGLVLAGCDMISNGTDYPSDGIIPTPTASPDPAARAVVNQGDEITLTCATEGASIYYTTDGSDPTTFSNLYSESTKPVITVTDKSVNNPQFIVKAIAMKEGLINSKVATFTYNVSANSITTPAVAKPKSTLGNKAAVGPGQKITLTCSTADASIYYTTDGSDPTKGSRLYSDDAKPEITGPEGAVTTIKAIAMKSGLKNSDIATFTYTIMMNRALAPDARADSPVWGDRVLLGTNITLTSETEGASIYYTTDGGVPSGSSTPYSGAITIEKDTTIKAIAVMSGMLDSPVATFSYYIAKSDTPTATVTTVKKDGAKQKAVAFTLTSTNTGTWKVYNVPTGGEPLSDVTASFNAPTLTLTDSGDDNLPVGTYYVSVTEDRKLESDRLALTVESHGIDISLVGELPAGVALSGNTYTVNTDGGYLVYNSDSSKTSGNITIAANKTVTLDLDDVTIIGGAPVTVSSGAKLTLLLSGESTLTTDFTAGINVTDGAELVIDSASQAGSSIGSLKVQGGNYGAGIGVSGGAVDGKLSISGGTVSAAGHFTAAAIGGYYWGNCGNITISGNAVVYAYSAGGNGDAAAIGGGGVHPAGTINIEGGVVVAIVGNRSSPSIGGGAGASGGSINISGGTIIANSRIGLGNGNALTPVTISGKPVIFAAGIDDSSASGKLIPSDGANGILANGEGVVTPAGESPNPATSGSVTLNSPFTIPAGAVLTVPQGWKVTDYLGASDLEPGAYPGPLTILGAAGVSITLGGGPKDETIGWSTSPAASISWLKGESLTATVDTGSDQWANGAAFEWYVDGTLIDGEASNAISIPAHDYRLGTHNLTAILTKDGVSYSKIVWFKITE